LKEWVIKNTSDAIKREFDRHVREENFEDDVWDLACDKLKNYNEYFAGNNPCNLNFTSLKKITPSLQQKMRIEAIGSYRFDDYAKMSNEEVDLYIGNSVSKSP
jgi:hypothetical protein